MTSKIKVDNINKVSDDSNIIKKCGSTITLGASGDSIALASGASQTGFGRTGTVDWQTSIKTASTFTATNGEGYFVDTSSNAITVTLPSGTAGAIVAFKDYAQNFDTNALTIAANGSDKIEGQTFDLVLETEGAATTLVFGDATKGWQSVNSNEITNTQKFVAASGGTITTSGDFKIHTFTGPGTFQVTCAGNAVGSNTVSYIVVAGGGGSGRGAGAGAGGFREGLGLNDSYTGSPLRAATGVPVTATSFPITVGAGGAGSAAGSGDNGTCGSASIFSTITSAGGGKGSDYGPTGTAGGSGSGSGSAGPGAGGAGNTPPVSPPQGNDGGDHPGPHAANFSGSGGGGAGAAGTDAPNPNVGTAGGAGVTTSITASPVAYAGGGGGAVLGPGGTGGAGGSGGGGAGNAGTGSPYAGTAGTVNTGGGGGGGSGSSSSAPTSGGGGAGGSGIVVIRYKFQ
tara:strand:+ start:406 stop:1773 length:1368 start_codon:yes stop_codon:yes gene_type:complete